MYGADIDWCSMCSGTLMCQGMDGSQTSATSCWMLACPGSKRTWTGRPYSELCFGIRELQRWLGHLWRWHAAALQTWQWRRNGTRNKLTVSLITQTCDADAGIRESTSGGLAVFPAAAFRLFMTCHTAVGAAVLCCCMVLYKCRTTAYACVYSSPSIDELHRGGRGLSKAAFNLT
ncbi:hypothetical protein V5799_024079 [Amblyomma americanum]|uniref:Uncharacterized protein n=1 Tax=Amblyomma americanum TaxID=6943 RepID=A0AAQ4EDF1_AMBAM